MHYNLHRRKSVFWFFFFSSSVKFRLLSLIYRQLFSNLWWRDPVSFHFWLQHMAQVCCAHFHQGNGRRISLCEGVTQDFLLTWLKSKTQYTHHCWELVTQSQLMEFGIENSLPPLWEAWGVALNQNEENVTRSWGKGDFLKNYWWEV